MVVGADHSGSEVMAGQPSNQLEVSEWTLPGGPGGEVTEGGLVVSCQLLACKKSEENILYDEVLFHNSYLLRTS